MFCYKAVKSIPENRLTENLKEVLNPEFKTQTFTGQDSQKRKQASWEKCSLNLSFKIPVIFL